MALVPLLIASAVYLVIEGLWLWFALPRVYTPVFKRIQGGKDVSYTPWWGLIAYPILCLGMWYLVVLHSRSRTELNVKSLMFSASVYGIYNLTMLACFEEYGVGTALIDTLWGVVAIGVFSNIAFR